MLLGSGNDDRTGIHGSDLRDSIVPAGARTDKGCMAIDWKKEWSLWKRIYFWYMRAGLISIPFGLIYGLMVLYLKHESKPALVIALAAAMITNYIVQGMPPDK